MRFDGPWEGRAVVLVENGVDRGGVQVFCVEEEAVHVKEAGPDGRKAGGDARGDAIGGR